MARGGLLGIAAIGAGAAVVVIVAAILVVRALAAGPAAAAIPAGGGANPNATVAEEGMHAPGAAELTKLGCEHALVVDTAKLLGSGGRVRPGEPRTMVTCDVPAGGEAPSCERAAATYFGAIGATAEDDVAVRVLRAGSSTPVCSRLYAPNGADLGVFPRPPPN
jgi:hypothetical protein